MLEGTRIYLTLMEFVWKGFVLVLSHTFFTLKFICPWCSPRIISFPVSLPKENHIF